MRVPVGEWELTPEAIRTLFVFNNWAHDWGMADGYTPDAEDIKELLLELYEEVKDLEPGEFVYRSRFAAFKHHDMKTVEFLLNVGYMDLPGKEVVEDV